MVFSLTIQKRLQTACELKSPRNIAFGGAAKITGTRKGHRDLERIEMQSEKNQMRFVPEEKEKKKGRLRQVKGNKPKKPHAVGGRNLGSSNIENNRCYNRQQVKY